MTDTEVLLAAADLIERNGLHKGELWPGALKGLPRKPGDPCCVMGAIEAVTGVRANVGSLDLVKRLRRSVGFAVDIWSDDSTQTEVVTTLRAVATSGETT